MQDIDNNMDNLLRKAAENYPVRINESDWDAIADRLNTPVERPARKGHASKYLRGLFVFLFFVTGGYFISREPHGSRLATAKATQTVIPRFADNPQTQAKEQTEDIITGKTNESRSISHGVPAERRLREQGHDVQSHDVQIDHGVIDEAIKTARVPALNGRPAVETNVQAEPPVITGPQKEQHQRKKTGRFYAGLVGGPEGNQVKGYVLSRCSYDVGLIAGYKLSNRLSLEAGVLLAKKHYFCEGQDFNMEMPGMKLESLEGKSTVLEIPVRLKYDLIQKKRWNVFSTAGVSSYLLANETNNYQLLVNGTRQNMISNYEDVSKYFAAAADISLGYEYKAGERLRLRLQPYMQLPLKGIGVGAIPVRSMGLHVGFTHHFR